jgi:DNA processing protein
LNPLPKKPSNQVEAILALMMVHQLGIQRIRLLLQSVEKPSEIFALPSDKLQEIDGIGPSLVKTITQFNDWNEVGRVLEETQRAGAQIVSFHDDDYPPLLREIYDPPLLLWVKGDPTVLDTPGIAIVGTRRASQYGLEQAKFFAKKLVEKRLTVVSGLAFGVDAAAHRTAVKEAGKTVAVLGSGIDNIYPFSHTGLAEEIIEEDGAVITEFLPGTKPDAGNFPLRNRIISGLTLGTLVAESGLKGGSMITAQSALTQNREVFVIPHSLDNRNGEGCNHLIKRSAGKLVQTTGDIIEELPLHIAIQGEQPNGHKRRRKPKWKSMDLDEESNAICKLLESKSYHIDELSAEMGVAPHSLLAKLLKLEMQQCVRQTSGKNFEIR